MSNGTTGTSEFVTEVGNCFARGGALSKATDNFVSRDGQRAYAMTVAECIETSGTCVLEAGTGTGKTFGYLTPALKSGHKVIVSTAGKPLQDQLFNKDLPAVERALGIKASTALLKGRNNYICLHRLDNTVREGFVPSPSCATDLKIIRTFAKTSRTGDRNEVKGVAEDSLIWPMVTSTKDNCPGKEKCEHWEKCFVNRARNIARASDVVVVNHHLFLSAMALKDEADQDMLPDAKVVIFDEAHKLPDIASSFFGNELHTYRVKESLKSIKRLLMSHAKSYAPQGDSWDAVCDRALYALMDFVLELDSIGLKEGDNRLIGDIEGIESAVAIYDKVLGHIDAILSHGATLMGLNDSLDEELAMLGDISVEMHEWQEKLKDPKKVTKNKEGTPTVLWIGRSRAEARFVETPITFSEEFARMRQACADKAWVFTSATLATEGNNFTHFLNDIGQPEAVTGAWESPFDYPGQAMLYVPERMPSPKMSLTGREDYMRALIRESWPVIDMLEGRTFILCTSYKAMALAAEYLREYIEANSRDYNVYVQGEDTRARIIENFRNVPHSILIATMGFWEGIDIRGDALSLVVIDKLPFAPMDDPVMTARSRWIEDKGGKPFYDLSVPMAAIALKQGAGRLIRSETDRGILLIGDTRVLPKNSSYWDKFLYSLPEYSRTRRLSRVVDFWNNPDSWV